MCSCNGCFKGVAILDLQRDWEALLHTEFYALFFLGFLLFLVLSVWRISYPFFSPLLNEISSFIHSKRIVSFGIGIAVMVRPQTSHPLDPLSAAEISVAVATVRAAGATPEVDCTIVFFWCRFFLNSLPSNGKSILDGAYQAVTSLY